MVRAAFTMIELIFAIVIIGLVSLSVPVILLNNSRSVEQNLMQEAILIASTELGTILTYPWDENSRNPDSDVLTKTEALDAAGDNELDRNVSDYRRGHFQQALRRKMSPLNVPRSVSAVLGLEGAETIATADDIDDFNTNVTSITHIGEDNYKHDYRINTAVAYVADTAAYNATTINGFDFDPTSVASSNIKMVEVQVDHLDVAGNWVPTVLLRTFSSNIGESDFYKRIY